MRAITWFSAIVALIIGFLGGWYVGASQPAAKQTPQISNVSSSKQETLKMNMRKLWEEHVTWTRLYAVDAIDNLPNVNNDLNRLMKNQEDIGNAIKPYYGSSAGDKLTSLLKEHIRLAGEVIKAAVNKDVGGLAKADKDWHDNGNQIADFLAGANPSWPQDQMRSMMNDHLNLTRQEAVDILAKNNDASISDYDKIENQILNMADMLSAGIIKQFPDKVSGSGSSSPMESSSPMGSPSESIMPSTPVPTSAPSLPGY